MYKISKKKCLAALLCVNVMGHIVSAPAIVQDPDLDLNRIAALVEKEIRALDKDLSKEDWYYARKCIPEEDRLLLAIMVRSRLSMMSEYDLRNNPGFVRIETGKTLVNFIEKRAYAHVITTIGNVKIAENAAKTEGNEFATFLRTNPSREGCKAYHFFGETFENRVKTNAMNGKYSY